MGDSKVTFIVGITIFFLFIVQVTGIWGVSFLQNADINFTPPPAPTSILDALAFVVGNFAVFFTIMSVSSTFLIIGSVIFLGYTIGMLWAILELIRGV